MTICRYFLQGNCRFGDRCRFEHTNSNQDYSRGNDHGYQERYNNRQYSQDAFYGSERYASTDKYNQQRSNYPEQYDRYQQQNNFGRNKQQYHYENNYRHGFQNNTWQGDSEYENYPASNRFSNKYERNDYDRNLDYKAPRGSFTTYNTSTPKSKVAFSFKDPGPLPKTDPSSDLCMNADNMFYADVMKRDAVEWDLGNLWPFTCYCPTTDKPCFPGFFDISPEEFRLEAYKAKENNTYREFIESVEKAKLDIKRKLEKLNEPSVELMSTIEKFRNGETFGSEYNLDGGNFFSQFSSNVISEEMVDEPQVPQQSTASSFSFKTTLETDSVVKQSASSFSFKLPPVSDSKQTVPNSSSNIYTPLEELTLQDKEEFLASTFSLGKIPTVPPPKTMCL